MKHGQYKNASHIQHLTGLHKEQSDLLGALDKSLTLEALWPGIFEHGKASSYLVRRGYNLHHLHVMAGNGEWRNFPIEDVPPILINQPMSTKKGNL